MKQWMCKIGMAAAGAMSALLAGCGLIGDQASSTFETENSVALDIKLADGSPAARAKVLVRPDDYLAGVKDSDEYLEKDFKDSVLGIFTSETNDSGRLNVPKLRPGNYLVEVRGDEEKGVERISVAPKTCDHVSMDLEETASMSGQVILPAGVASATVGIRGLDYFVQTDSLGNFEFKSLPAGSFKAVGFNAYTTEYVDDNGDTEVYDNFRTFGVVSVSVDAGESLDSLTIGRKPVAEKDTLPYFIDDFENGTYGWTVSNSKYTTAKLTAVDGGGKYGQVARLSCSKDSTYNVWTMMGHDFNDFHDFSDLDSVIVWARGENPDDDSMWVSVSFDVQVNNNSADSSLGYESGKAWAHVGLNKDGSWTKVKVTPKTLSPADSNKIGGNIGWDAVKTHVNRFGIFIGRKDPGEYKLYVDDVQIYGIRGLYE